MNFTDPQLQKCYESNFTGAGGVSDDLRQVRALIGVHDLFRMLEGPHSSRVHETVEHLLLPGLRPGLRRWYQCSDADKDFAAVALRDHLSQLAGEKLEHNNDIPIVGTTASTALASGIAAGFAEKKKVAPVQAEQALRQGPALQHQ